MLNIDEHTHLEALARGDKKGLDWIFDQYRKPIFHFCLKLLKENSLAEEATADVFIKIWEKRNVINTDRSIQAFLYKIARDTAFSYLRKVASNERLKQKFLENYPLTDHKHGEWIYLKKEHATAVANIVGVLPPQRQLIFRMKYFEGKDNSAIAEELNLSVHTVKSQLVKARTYVRKRLGVLDSTNLCVLLLLLMLN